MGGELFAKLFVGPVKEQSISSWMYLFGIITDDILLDRIKSEDDYIERDEHTHEDDIDLLICCAENYLDEYFEEFQDFLENNNLNLITDCNCNNEVFFIGRKIDNIRQDISSDIQFWDKYNVNDIDVFAGMIGELQLSFQFERNVSNASNVST